MTSQGVVWRVGGSELVGVVLACEGATAWIFWVNPPWSRRRGRPRDGPGPVCLLELLESLKLADVNDHIRSATETLYQALIEAELTAAIGAGRHERADARTAPRNGHRPRTLTTTAGALELRIPKLRAGSFLHSLMERRRRIDQTSFAVVLEAYPHGVRAANVDDLVKALGADAGISNTEVSRICADLDNEVAAFRDRTWTEIAFPDVFLDAAYRKARVIRRVARQAVVIATRGAPTGTGRCSASSPATARTARSGPRSYAR